MEEEADCTHEHWDRGLDAAYVFRSHSFLPLFRLSAEIISWQALFARLSYVHHTYGALCRRSHRCPPWAVPGSLQLQQIAWITSRRLSQYPTPAKKTSMTCDINNGLWSARGLMISNSLTALALWGLWVPAREIWWNNSRVFMVG